MSKDVSPELRSAVDALIDGMAFVESKTVREIMLRCNLHSSQRNLHISDTQNVQMDREVRVLRERWSK